METFRESKIFRVGYGLYVGLALSVLLFAKISYRHQILAIMVGEGGHEPIPEGPLVCLGNWAFLFAILLAILVIFLPQIIHFFRIPDVPLQRCLCLASIFWLFSILVWFATELDIVYLAYFIAYGGFIGIVEGVWRNPIHPTFLSNDNLDTEGKKEMIKFEDQKWWRGLNLLWIVIVGVAVSGVLQWVLSASASEVPYLTAKETVFLVLGIVPAIALLTWHFIKRTNYLHQKLGELHQQTPTKKSTL